MSPAVIGQGRGAWTRRWKHVGIAAFPLKEVFGPVWWPGLSKARCVFV